MAEAPDDEPKVFPEWAHPAEGYLPERKMVRLQRRLGQIRNILPRCYRPTLVLRYWLEGNEFGDVIITEDNVKRVIGALQAYEESKKQKPKQPINDKTE